MIAIPLKSCTVPTVVLILVALIAYAPAMRAGFIWDDDDYVTENETLRDGVGLVQIWTDPSATPQYYPFVHTTFWLEYQAWGLWAPGYHLVNVILHIASSVLLWKLCERLGIRGAWWVGLLFAIHPVHVESVAWITERKNVLSGLFYLLAASAYLKYAGVIGTSAGRKKTYAASVAFFVAALLSKTVTATLPAALLLIVWWKRGVVARREMLELGPMFLIGVSMGLMTAWLEKTQVGADGIDWQLSGVERVLIAGRVIAFYAGKLLWPMNLIFTYPRWEIDATAVWQYAFPTGVLAVIVIAFALRHRIGRGPVTAVCLFCGTLFPALGFIDVYPMRFSFVADHFQYLASIPILVLLTWSIVRLWTNLLSLNGVTGRRTGVALASLGVLALCVLTWRQTLIYRDLETLWRDTLARNPTSWMAHNNLGALLNRRGDFAEAESHLRESVRLKPGFSDSVNNLGKAREGQGDVQGAITFYEAAVKLSPNDARAINNLAAMRGATGDLDEAARLIGQAIAINPKLAGAYGNLGSVEATRGNVDAAIENYERSLELDPQSIEVRLNLARLLIGTQKFERATEQLSQILQQNPRHTGALLNRGIVEVNQRKFERAIETFEEVLRIQPNQFMALQNLAYTYSQLGDNDRADAYAEMAARVQGP